MTRPKALIINGIEFPVAFKGYKHSRNKIWSTNTGRTESGKMVGTIIAIKNKVEVSLAPITPEKAAILDSVISDMNNPFPRAKILNVDGTQKEITIYTGDVSYEWISTTIGNGGLITGIKISCIEQ